MLTRSFKIGMNAGHIVTPVIHVNQYDHDEQWIFTLVDDNGVVYTPTTGGIVGLKADGNVILNAGTVNSSGQVVINETQQMTAAAGDATYELLLDNSTHGCANFTVRVEPKPGDNATYSDSDLSLLQEAIDSTIPANIEAAVQDWMDDNLAPSQWVIDNTLSISGAAADAKKTGDGLNELKTEIDIFTIGKNLFNKDAVINGKYISVDNGTVANNEASSTSEYIEISPDTTYIISCNSPTNIRYALYDHNKTFISGLKSSDAFTTPSTAAYIRISMLTVSLNTAQLEEGSTATSYEPYYKVIETKYIWSPELENEVENVVSPAYQQIDYLKNGIDYIALDYYPGFIGGTGDITVPTANKELYTNKVPVTEGDTINISLNYDEPRAMWLAYATYDENEVFKSRTALINTTVENYDGTVTIGTGVSYVVFTFRSYDIATFTATRTAAFYSELTSDLETYQPKLSKTVKSIAHRGDDVDAPQCTKPAYIIARKKGFEIAENDVWYSEDGEYVMEHNTTLARLGNMVDINGYLMYTDGTVYYWVNPSNNAVYTWDGTNYIASSVSLSSLTRCNGSNYGVNSTFDVIGLNFDILRRIDFGVYKGSKFKGTQIMTFEEFVLLCKQLGMEIYIDRKWNYTNEQIADLANIVKKYGMGDKASWLGMDGAKIIALRNIIPDSRCCLLQHPSQALIEAYTPYNTGRGFFFNGNGKTMTEAEIQLGLNAGFEVEVWYVDYGTLTENQILDTIRTAVSYGVTGLTLDHYRVDDAFAYLMEQY